MFHPQRLPQPLGEYHCLLRFSPFFLVEAPFPQSYALKERHSLPGIPALQGYVREALMSPRIIFRLFSLLLAVFAFSSIRVVAQDDAASVADAARRSRQQKQDAAKPAHVIDNDVIPSAPASASSSAPAASASNSATPAQPAADAAAKKTDGDSANDESKKKEIDALKQEIADKKASLNLVQRQLSLDQDTYLSNPDHERDKAGKEKLDSMQLDISQAQSELDVLLAKLAALAPPSDSANPNSPAVPNAPATPETPAKP
jgi:hypothetical protein